MKKRVFLIEFDNDNQVVFADKEGQVSWWSGNEVDPVGYLLGHVSLIVSLVGCSSNIFQTHLLLID